MNIGGIVKNSFVDYPEKIACVIFTTGCNMNCWYCHNKHLLNGNPSKLDENEILNFLQEHKTFLDAVVISGGEPTLQPDLQDFIKKIKGMGYLIKLDTNGTNYTELKNLIENNLIDYVAMDIKAPIDKYSLITSCYDIQSIKRSILLLKQGKIKYEFRTTFSPDLTLDDFLSIAKELKGAENYSIQQYKIPKYLESKGAKQNNISNKNIEIDSDKLNLKPVDDSFLINAKHIAQSYIKNVIVKGL